eukprot:4648451-Karenia_brevis.AAC.1
MPWTDTIAKLAGGSGIHHKLSLAFLGYSGVPGSSCHLLGSHGASRTLWCDPWVTAIQLNAAV